jgi:hypothetical protein
MQSPFESEYTAPDYTNEVWREREPFPVTSWRDMIPALVLIAASLLGYAVGFTHGTLEARPAQSQSPKI